MSIIMLQAFKSALVAWTILDPSVSLTVPIIRGAPAALSSNARCQHFPCFCVCYCQSLQCCRMWWRSDAPNAWGSNVHVSYHIGSYARDVFLNDNNKMNHVFIWAFTSIGGWLPWLKNGAQDVSVAGTAQLGIRGRMAGGCRTVPASVVVPAWDGKGGPSFRGLNGASWLHWNQHHSWPNWSGLWNILMYAA